VTDAATITIVRIHHQNNQLYFRTKNFPQQEISACGFLDPLRGAEETSQIDDNQTANICSAASYRLD
jgi:hypothetical protein